MTINQARQITLNELKKSGYNFKEIQSKSTTSYYYTIWSESGKMIFRIADHCTKKNIITFRIDHKTSCDKMQNFVKARVKDLTVRNTKKILGL